MTADQPLRVVVADDQASVREGLVLLLGGLPGIDVVGAAADGEQALELVAGTSPTRSCSTCACPSWTASPRPAGSSPSIRVSPRRAHHVFDDTSVLEALRAGDAQLHHQGRRPDRHRPRAAAAVGGLTVFDPRVHPTLLAATSRAAVSPDGMSATPVGTATRPPAPPDGLTQREAEILSLIAQGLTNPEIAKGLFLSNHTVKTDVNRIFAKTGSRDRVAAIGYAQRHNIG